MKEKEKFSWKARVIEERKQVSLYNKRRNLIYSEKKKEEINKWRINPNHQKMYKPLIVDCKTILLC